MAFYEKGSEILELKKDGTFYLDKSLYRAIYRTTHGTPKVVGGIPKYNEAKAICWTGAGKVKRFRI